MANLTGKPRPVTDYEKEFIITHHKTKTVAEMGYELKRSINTIYRYMKDNQLQILTSKFAKRKAAPVQALVPPDCFDVDKMKDGWLV